jgi:cytochrome P450
MDGIEFDDNMNENGAIHMRVLGVVLKSHLDDLQSTIYAAITDATAESIDASSRIDGWAEVDSFAFATQIVAQANAVVFFGSDLASNPAFINAAMEYPKELFLMAEMLRFLPQVLRPYAARALKTKFQSLETLVAYLVPLVERRFEERHTTKGSQHRDLVQFFIESSQRKGMWSVQRIVQVILGVWFASVHQPALTLVSILEDLHAQPEVVRLIREEVFAVTDNKGVPMHVDKSPLLDSFIKESARLHPTDSITARRKAIKPFEFSDGTILEKNDIVCISLEALMQDSKHYSQSRSFDAYRHMKSSSMTSQSRFSDPSPEFPLWGLGRHVW